MSKKKDLSAGAEQWEQFKQAPKRVMKTVRISLGINVKERWHFRFSRALVKQIETDLGQNENIFLRVFYSAPLDSLRFEFEVNEERMDQRHGFIVRFHPVLCVATTRLFRQWKLLKRFQNRNKIWFTPYKAATKAKKSIWTIKLKEGESL